MVVRVKCESEWNAISIFLLSRLYCCLSINLFGDGILDAKMNTTSN